MTDAGVSQSTPERRVAEDPLSGREVRAAILAAAGLYAVGGALCATALLLPHVRAPAAIAAVGVNAYIVAATLVLAAQRKRGGLELAFVADLWGVVLIAVLCAGSNGASSPFALIYFFAIGHAAAFQPRGRFVLVTLAGLIAFLLPIAYEDVSATFGAVACVGLVLAILTTVVIHLALNGMREHRRRLKFLIDATATFDSSLDPAEALRNLARAAVPELAELCVIYLLDRDGQIERTVAASVDPALAREVERVREQIPLDLAGVHPVAEVLRTGEPRVVADLTDQAALARIAESDEHQQIMRDAGYRSAAVFPMVARGRTHGAISFLHIDNDAPYGRGVLDVLADLSDRAALAFDNARLYAERSYVAQTLRRSLMPSSLPVDPRPRARELLPPARRRQRSRRRLLRRLRRRAQLLAGRRRRLRQGRRGGRADRLPAPHDRRLRARRRQPGRVLSQVNRVMLDQDFDGRFATAILVHLRFTGGRVAVTLASAGHPAALLTRAGGATTQLGERGALLGVFADAEIRETSAVLQPGDSLALYTDGLLEAHAPEQTVTPEQMIERLGASAPEAAREAIEALLTLVELDDRVRDDIAILSARVTPAASSVSTLEQRPRAAGTALGAEELELGVAASAEGARRGV